MTRQYPGLGSTSDWLNQISHVGRPIRSTTQILVAKQHKYEISALFSQTSFGGETVVEMRPRLALSLATLKFSPVLGIQLHLLNPHVVLGNLYSEFV